MLQITDNHELQEAVHHQRLGRLREAETIYRRLLQAQPRAAELHYNLAGLLNAAGRLDEAAESYRTAIGIKPLHSDALNNLALVLLEQGRLDEAMAACRQAIAAAPNHSAAHNNLGNTLRRRGCLDEAIDCYRQALACGPPQRGALTSGKPSSRLGCGGTAGRRTRCGRRPQRFLHSSKVRCFSPG